MLILMKIMLIFLHYGDLTDSSFNKIIQKTKPDEIYNLGAKSCSSQFETPEYAANSDHLEQ